MDNNAPFFGALLKIERAKQHIRDLVAVLKAFMETDFYELAIKDHEDGASQVLQFAQKADVPSVMPLIIGDAIHNLRSSLDLAYYEMVNRIGGTPTDWTRFQFFDTRTELVDRLGNGVLQRFPDVVTLLADVIKPYKAGNPIYALHELDIADKHILILPFFAVSTVVVSGKTINPDGRVGITFTDYEIGVDDRGILKPIVAVGRIELDGQPKPAFHVIFGKGRPLEREPVIPTLVNLTNAVGSIVNEFDKALKKRVAPAP